MESEHLASSGDSSARDLLREAVEFLAETFENSEEVSGATLVDWFSEWRVRAQEALRTIGAQHPT